MTKSNVKLLPSLPWRTWPFLSVLEQRAATVKWPPTKSQGFLQWLLLLQTMQTHPLI